MTDAGPERGWDNEADVVVVGGGGAGLAAAIEAASLGRSVTLLEKNRELGGSTAWSVGSISVTNTPHQWRLGIQDHPDAHYQDLEVLAGEHAWRDNRRLRRVLVENIHDTFTWLERMGLVFVGPMHEPPHRYPRMHNILPNSRMFPKQLGKEAQRLGVRICLETPVEELLFENHRVAGVRVSDSRGEARTIFARGAVVLAGGDYSANSALLEEFAGPAAARLSPVNPTATGEGIALGRAAGGQVVNGDFVRGPVLRFVPPPARRIADLLPPIAAVARVMRWGYEHLPARMTRPIMMRFLTTALGLSLDIVKAGAVLVNAAGERFVDEREISRIANATTEQPGAKAWVLFDQSIAAQFTAWPHFISTAPGVAYAYLDDYRRTRKDVYHCAESIAGLAAAAGLPAAGLERIASRANEARGPGAQFGNRGLGPGPYYLLGPVKAYVVFTDGGLNVDEGLHVLDANGAAIPGIYAAGSNGQGGAVLEGHGHHLGWAFVSGRIAGRNAAFAVPPRVPNDPSPQLES